MLILAEVSQAFIRLAFAVSGSVEEFGAPSLNDAQNRSLCPLDARLGGFFVREYEVLGRPPVTILIDGSRSMLHPQKSSNSPDGWPTASAGCRAASRAMPSGQAGWRWPAAALPRCQPRR